ncbi:MAG: hypothetical protein H0S80_06210 [Desulfovibrionaceae bacterium]|nr:hypothetical protein [Desulfovibrionaceae bacterium]
MLDVDTIYLLLVMIGFILVAIVLLHSHSCTDTIRKKRNEVLNVTHRLEKMIATLEQEVAALQIRVEEVDDRISFLQEQVEP